MKLVYANTSTHITSQWETHIVKKMRRKKLSAFDVQKVKYSHVQRQTKNSHFSTMSVRKFPSFPLFETLNSLTSLSTVTVSLHWTVFQDAKHLKQNFPTATSLHKKPHKWGKNTE